MPVQAALPELSSIEPIEYDEAAQRIVARGEARFDLNDFRLQADRITYYQTFGLADAEGNVQLTRGSYRLLGDRLSYDTTENIFSVDAFRSGSWPFYIEGSVAGGGTKEASMENTTLYYGDPGPFTINVHADRVRYSDQGEGRITLEKTTFRFGSVPLFYLPGYSQSQGAPPFHLKLDGGYSSTLGAHLQSTTLFSVRPWLRLGANLDAYSERGILAGPAAQYVYNSESQQIQGALNFASIHDQGKTGVDLLDREIKKRRGFAELRHKHHLGNRFTLTGTASYWSDSEITRDFRRSYYKENHQPDNFVEGVYAGDNYLLTGFTRFRPNDFSLVQERLPELRLDVLPVPLASTGAYHHGSVSYARLREDLSDFSPFPDQPNRTDRIDLNYRIQRPFPLANWLVFSPLTGARITHYENQEAADSSLPADNTSHTRDIFELGFDLEATAYALYPTRNSIWGVDGLRHIVRPVMRYRYYSNPGSSDSIVQIERELFDNNRPILDLSDLRNTDQISSGNLLRLGVENLYQTKARDGAYGSRNLAELNFYQDILFQRKQQIGSGEKADGLHASWVECIFTPAPWLRFNLMTRLSTEKLRVEEVRTRTALVSGESWELGLSSDFIRNRIQQYAIDFIYRLNERCILLADGRLDAQNNELMSSRIALSTKLSSTWELVYDLTYRDESSRENDLELNIALRLMGP